MPRTSIALPRPVLLSTLLCTLLASLAPAALAQTQPVPYLMTQIAQLPEFSRGGDGVRIYGTVDMGGMYSTTDNASGRWQLQSGGDYTSKLGFYASEDLGGGVKAEIKLEAGFNADTGVQQANALFNRESWIGLRSATLGTVRLGNQINAMLPLYIDPFLLVSTNSAYTWVGGGAMQSARGVGANTDLGPGAGTIPVRVPKSITYATPRFKGLSAQAILATNPTGGREPKFGVRGGTLGWNAGPVYLAASLTQSWSSPVVVASTLPAQPVRTDMPAVGAIFDNGQLVLSTSYVRIKPRLAQSGEAELTTLGVILPRGRLTYRGSAVHRDTEGARDGAGRLVESSALGLMFGADYALSRRTSLYARAGSVRNFGASTIMLNGIALPFQPGSTAPQTGIETRTASVGMFHHF
ncbi:porin [Massilia niabensis]|uniref:Porin n=1 Tax=Massilia niabensis TaxID=544910 RepID=A0ABW0L520_9BURK